MATTLEYDDEELQRLFAEMVPKQRRKALKKAFRREGNKVRKIAINNLRRSIRSNRDLERGIRVEVYRRKAGFRVTIGTKVSKRGKTYGIHTNRKGLKKPVLIWAEIGTDWRKSKTPTRYLAGGRWRTGDKRGFMKQYGFMQKTMDDTRVSVTNSLRNEIVNSVKEVAKKHGCT